MIIKTFYVKRYFQENSYPPIPIIKKKILVFFMLILVFPMFLNAQIASLYETVLESQAVTCGQAAVFILGSTVKFNYNNAFDFAAEEGWFKNVKPDDKITFARLSFLLMKVFDIKGGIMYRLIPGPHYAYRSMVSQSFIQGTCDPSMKVSGQNFFLILGKVLTVHGRESYKTRTAADNSLLFNELEDDEEFNKTFEEEAIDDSSIQSTIHIYR